MTIVIVLLGLALIASLAFNLGLVGSKATSSSPTTSSASSSTGRNDDDLASRAAKLESELDKKRKELDEVKKAQGDLKTELKDAKKKLFEQKEAAKTGDDLVKARAEVERQASMQLETTRHELANALADIQRLKGEIENKGRKPRPTEAPAAAAPSVEAKPEEKREVVVQRVIRELSEAEKEKMQRLEQQAAADKKKAIEIAAELRNVKGKIDREKREAKRVFEEGRLARDKFRAVEMRLNRTLLENDLLKRAISGLEEDRHGGRTPHPPPMSSRSRDAAMTAKHAAEDKAAAEAQAKLEAAEATVGEVEAAAVPAPTPSSPSPAPAA